MSHKSLTVKQHRSFSIYQADIPVCFDDEEICQEDIPVHFDDEEISYQSNSEFRNFEAVRKLHFVEYKLQTIDFSLTVQIC
jgi:hypothetical protein